MPLYDFCAPYRAPKQGASKQTASDGTNGISVLRIKGSLRIITGNLCRKNQCPAEGPGPKGRNRAAGMEIFGWTCYNQNEEMPFPLF